MDFYVEKGCYFFGWVVIFADLEYKSVWVKYLKYKFIIIYVAVEDVGKFGIRIKIFW